MQTPRTSTARKALTLALIASLCAISLVRAQAQESSPEVVEEEHLEELEPLSDDESGGMADDACSVVANFPPEGMEGTPEEVRARCEAEQQRHFIRARELAEAIVREHPRSYAAHYVLGYVHHYGEANVPRSLFHLNEALRLYRAAHSDPPEPGDPWRWHSSILRELVWAHADLEQYTEQLGAIARYNELYQPHLIAEAAWPMMKMRRFDDARRLAEAADATGDPMQQEIALNARCAIEYEAGDETRSFAACRAALELHGRNPDSQSAVDFTNFAEAARSVFHLEEAEEVSLEATRAQLSWYGNPYIELTELYLREGRFAEALAMMREVNPYRMRRPPHVQDADRNEARRALSSLFIILGRGEDAVRISTKTVVAPDRRGHNSRDAFQDLALSSLLDRAARRLRAQEIHQASLGAPFFDQLQARAEMLMLDVQAWSSGRQAARALTDEERLVGTFQIGRARSAVTPPWLIGDLVEVLGSGVVASAVRRARAQDPREFAPGYYDAFECEAALAGGDADRAMELATRALERLPQAELLVRARASLVQAEAAMDLGDNARALAAYDQTLQIDPGLFVRLGRALPVSIHARGGSIPEAVSSLLAWSPRFDQNDIGFRVDIDGDSSHVRTCLASQSPRTSAQYACVDVQREAAEEEDVFVARAAREFHRQAFAPRVDLSQSDATSLDGSNTVSRQPGDSVINMPDE